jgi:RHS repeat-associated protein
VYIVGLPARALTRDAAGTTIAETWFYYDGEPLHTTPPTIGNLTQRCHWLNGGTNPCVTMAYDAFGNLTATTDARGNTTTITYDAMFQTFPVTVTTPPTANAPSGLVTTSAYDARFAVVTSTTDPNNQTTTYAYDTFGRVTATTNPLGHTSTTSYDAFGTVGSQRVTSRLPDASSDGLWTEEYFDGLGRTFQVRKEAAVSQVTVLETAFDSRGLVSQKSLPRFEGAAPLWTTFAYDPLGRPTTTTFPDGTTETTAYSDWTTTLTDRAGRTRSSVKDAYGRITQITEPGGAITTYAYDTMGRLNRVTDAATNVTTIAYDTLGRKTSMTEPNMGTWAYVYDANGNLTSQTDAKGQTLTFAYDALNRLTTKAYPGGATVSFTYDTGLNGKGRRTAMTDLAGSASYAYDVLGRQISVTRVTDGVSYTTQTTYTSLGQPASLTYPDGEVLTYTYDAGGRVFSVAGAQTYVSSMTYNASAQVTQVTFGNGVLTNYTYGATTLRLTSLVTSQGATSLQNLSYTYDNVGNIAAITDNRTPSNNRSFAYDSLDRLTSATGPYGTETYSYNTIGNLLSKAGVSYTYGATGQTCNRLMPHAVTGTSDGKTYTYDCNGNLLADGQRTLTWDADNRPVSITLTGVGTTTLAYSGDGARVKKVGTTRAIRYAGAFEDHLTELAQVKHIFAGPLRVATRVTSGGPNAGAYFVHGDHLGSLNVLTNSQGAEVQRLTYRPWGETQSNTGTVDFDQRRFTGQEQDPETGLYFYQARYYHPELGRFLSPDPLVPGAGDPQNLNRYSYANNNPVNFTDPTGHFSFKKFFKRIIPIIVGVVVAIVAPPLGAPTVGMLAGMSAGATGAIVNGSNVLQGALMGGVFGALGGALAPGLFGGLGGVSGAGFWANLGPTLGTAGILGAGFGGLQAAMGGTSILEGMAVGALTAAAVAAVVYGGIELYEQANRSPALASASNVSEASTANSNYIPDETASGGFSDQPLNQPDTRLAARYVIGTDVVSDMDPLMIMPSPVTGPGLAAIRYGANPAYKALNTLSRSLWGKPIESFFRIERGFIHGMGRDTLHINIGGRGSGLPFNLHIHRGNMYRFWEWHK